MKITKLLVLVAAFSTLVAHAADVEMKHYRNEQWKFELDVPKQWTVLPTGGAQASNQLVRFISTEHGKHQLLVSRHLLQPAQTARKVLEQNQKGLANKGSRNFVAGEATIGSNRVLTLDFETTAPDGTTWYTRHYYVIEGPVGYQLAFGTSDRESMFDLYGRMARSFTFEDL